MRPLVALLNHATFPELQKSACLALISVVYQSQNNQRSFTDARALDGLLPLLKVRHRHLGASHLNLAAAYAMAVLSWRNPQVQKYLLTQNVITVLLDWLPLTEKGPYEWKHERSRVIPIYKIGSLRFSFHSCSRP